MVLPDRGDNAPWLPSMRGRMWLILTSFRIERRRGKLASDLAKAKRENRKKNILRKL